MLHDILYLSLNESFWNKPSVKQYIELNPLWNDGYDLFIGWEMNEINLQKMHETLYKKHEEINKINK